MSDLAVELRSRLHAINMLGKSLTLKLKVRQEGAPRETSKFLGHGVCNNLAKSVTMATATDEIDVIRRESLNLLKQVKVPACEMRGVGILPVWDRVAYKSLAKVCYRLTPQN